MPPPPVLNAQDLVTRVVEDLGRAWEAGMELTVQMLAQEIQRMAPMYTGNQARVLQLAAEGCRGYVVEGFQVGIVLSPRWSMWINALITDSGNALEVGSTAGDFMEETDVSSLMGKDNPHPWRDESRPRGKGGRAGEGSRGRDRSRSRERSDTREDEGADNKEEDRYRNIPPWATSSSVTPRTRTSARGAYSTTARRLDPSRGAITAAALNRHTWRCLLGMQEDNAGTQEDEYLDRPVDAIASGHRRDPHSCRKGCIPRILPPVHAGACATSQRDLCHRAFLSVGRRWKHRADADATRAGSGKQAAHHDGHGQGCPGQGDPISPT